MDVINKNDVMNENNGHIENQPLNLKEIPSLDCIIGSINNRETKRITENSLLREMAALFVKIAVISGIAVILFTFVYGLYYNVDPDMNQSVKDGDLAMYYRWDKNYHAGDLVVLTFQGNKQIRRVIASSGDTVDITEDGLIINGALQQEQGIYQKTQRYADGVSFPVTLGEGQIFVLGDARTNAVDSRVYGPVNVGDTHGKVIAVLRRRNL
ncbi:MAG: signal peptidase I [Oscillospiraceae bacterium]|nr:signal peptidase I [Oscillospiraceae bacterium]